MRVVLRTIRRADAVGEGSRLTDLPKTIRTIKGVSRPWLTECPLYGPHLPRHSPAGAADDVQLAAVLGGLAAVGFTGTSSGCGRRQRSFAIHNSCRPSLKGAKTTSSRGDMPMVT